jgi:hypothetical protein
MPGSSVFPTSLDTISNLFEVANNAISTLATAITSGDTSLTLANAANFPSSGAISIDSEILYYTGKSTNTLTGVSRGQDGTTAAAHNSGTAVEMRYTASHHAVLNAAIRALQAKLGIGGSTAAAGQFLRGSGAGSSTWAAIQAGDLPAIALDSMVTGVLPVANGGTGSNSQNFVDLSNNQTSINGNKSFVGVSTLGSGTSYNEAAAASQGATAQAVRITTGSAGSPNATNLPVISAQKQSSANLLSSESEIPFLFTTRKQSGGGNLYALYSTIRQESATLTDSSALTGNSFIDPVGYVLNAPSATPSASGGTLATGTYYYKVTAIIGGVETIASWEASAAVTGPTGSVNLSWGAVTGASQYKVYRSTTSEAQDTRIKTTAATSYVDNGTTEGAATPPAQTNWAMWGRIERTGPVRLSGAEFGVSNTTGVDASRLPQSTNATFGVNIVGTGNATTTTARNNTAGIIFQSGFPLGKFYNGIYFSANTIVDQAINFQPLGSSVPATLHANNQYDTWYTTGNVAKRLATLNASNVWEFDPDGQTAAFNSDVIISNAQTNKITLKSLNIAGTFYPGIWFGSAAPSNTNYSFLADGGISILNGSSQVDLRIANAGAWMVNSSRHFIAQTDNSFDIGASGVTRPRTLYLGTSLSIAGGTALATTNQTGTGNLVMATSPTLVTPNIGAATGASLSLGGDITLTGSARRLRADMSSSPISNRFGFQTSTTDGNTVMSVIPNGISTTSAIRAFGTSDPDNANLGGLLVASNSVRLESSAAGTGTTQPIWLTINGTTKLEVAVLGSVVIGSAALATTATDGFLYIPTCAGTPTGVPTAFTGRVPMVYDTSANKFWIYNGSWRGVVLS